MEQVKSDRLVSDVQPVVEVRGLVKHYPVRRGVLRVGRGHVQAVDGVDLAIPRGTTVGLVGESGSGKSTVARLLVGLVEPTGGEVLLDGVDITGRRGKEILAVRRRIQMVFQDPYSSFDPLSSIGDSIAESLKTHTSMSSADQMKRSREVLSQVGLPGRYLERYPSEMSGGQLQRAAVARALVNEPEVLVLDEPVSALDVSTQAQVINLLEDLQAETGVSLLFIAHDLAVVRHISQRIAVMYLGRIVEEGPADQIYDRPTHPYTQALLSAIPEPNPAVQRSRRRTILEGDIPSPLNPPSGCRFRTRCPYVMDVCATKPPAFPTPAGGVSHCHLHTSGPKLSGSPINEAVQGLPTSSLGDVLHRDDHASPPSRGDEVSSTKFP